MPLYPSGWVGTRYPSGPPAYRKNLGAAAAAASRRASRSGSRRKRHSFCSPFAAPQAPQKGTQTKAAIYTFDRRERKKCGAAGTVDSGKDRPVIHRALSNAHFLHHPTEWSRFALSRVESGRNGSGKVGSGRVQSGPVGLDRIGPVRFSSVRVGSCWVGMGLVQPKK
eukprot:gene22395-biopygen20736